MCHLYLNLKPEESLSKDFFAKNHKGRSLLINAKTEYKSRLTGAQANEKLRELLNTGDDYWLCTDDKARNLALGVIDEFEKKA